MTPLRAYHGTESIKAAILAQLARHREADELMKGRYWENGKGCAVGCTLHSGDHAEYEPRFGIPQMLAYLEDAIFEGLPNGAAKAWPERFMAAIKPDSDLSLVGWKFQYWLMTDENVNPGINHPLVREVVKRCANVLAPLTRGGPVDQAAAESARAAADEAAESAAWSAARSAARSAAESAAESAESAARSARSAAWSAAESAESARAARAARSAAWSAAWSAAESAESARAARAARSAESAARSAAWSAAESAESARAARAARSAARAAAESAAWSAESARAAADEAAESAAWSAARSAAWSAAYIMMSDKLIELIEAA